MDKQDRNGIWVFAKLLPAVTPQFRLSLAEGQTPLTDIDGILFKHEYDNPTGSIKDRGMAYAISALYEQNIKSAVLSSSGNAAISAATYCRLANIKLKVFVSPKINKSKRKIIKELGCGIVVSKKPISNAFRYARKNKAYNLRQSTDPNATVGPMTLAYELIKQQPDIDAIFIPISSGSNLVGIVEGYHKLKYKLPAIHAVQTQAVCPIASVFDKNYIYKSTSIAQAIVAKFIPKEQEIINIIKNSKGSGWVIDDDSIITAHQWLNNKNIICSYEGAAALAAVWKAKKNGFSYKNPVCILTGRYYPENK